MVAWVLISIHVYQIGEIYAGNDRELWYMVKIPRLLNKDVTVKRLQILGQILVLDWWSMSNQNDPNQSHTEEKFKQNKSSSI